MSTDLIDSEYELQQLEDDDFEDHLAEYDETVDDINIPPVVQALFLLMRTVMSHGTGHPLARRHANELRKCLTRADPPFSLQFVGPAFFKDMVLIPMDLKRFLFSMVLSKALKNSSINELSFLAVPETDTLLQFGVYLSEGVRGPSEALMDSRLDDIDWRDMDGANWGMSEDIEPEVYTTTMVALASADAEHLAAKKGEKWDWSRGLGVIRRLERATRVSARATDRALEFAPHGWSPARRAVSSTFRALQVMGQLRSTISIRRSVGHAVLALACHGYDVREGRTLDEVVPELVDRLLQARSFSRTGIEPHRIRVASIVNHLGTHHSEDHEIGGLLNLVRMVYDIEFRRAPLSLPVFLTNGDLLSYVASKAGTLYDPSFIACLVQCAGEIPVGAVVQLANGSRGMVLTTNGEDPFKPKVLVGNRLVIPDAPVKLVTTLTG